MLERYKHVENIKLIVAILVFLGLFIGSTFAYYRTIDHIDNDFETSKYKTEANEVFTSPTNWKPGDTTPKELTVTNNGDICENVRVSYEEKWEDKDGNLLHPEQDLTLINYSDSGDWIPEHGYYYYKNNLQPGETTSSLLDSVTYKKDIPKDFECETSGNTSKCTKAGGKFAGATYSLIFNIETIECNATEKVWNINPDRIGDRAIFDKGEIVNVKLKQLMDATAGGGILVNDSTIDFSTVFYTPVFVYTVPNTTHTGTCTMGSGNTGCVVVSAPESPITIYAIKDFNSVNHSFVIRFETEANEAYLNEDASSMFEGFASLQLFYQVSFYQPTLVFACNTSNTKKMSRMFKNTTSLSNISMLANWDTSNVTSFYRMFDNDSKGSLTDISALSSWDTSKVTDMSYMFRRQLVASAAPMANWDVSNVKYIVALFMCNYTLSNISAMNNWHLDSIVDIRQVFSECLSLSNISPLANWDISNCTSLHGVFKTCISLSDLTPIANWNTSKVTDMHLFLSFDMGHVDADYVDNNAYMIVSDLSPLSNWDTSKVTNMQSIFVKCANLTNLNALANWNTSSVTNVSYAFNACSGLTNASGINNWNLRNVFYVSNTDATTNGFYHMFSGCNVTSTFTNPSGRWYQGSFIPS